LIAGIVALVFGLIEAPERGWLSPVALVSFGIASATRSFSTGTAGMILVFLALYGAPRAPDEMRHAELAQARERGAPPGPATDVDPPAPNIRPVVRCMHGCPAGWSEEEAGACGRPTRLCDARWLVTLAAVFDGTRHLDLEACFNFRDIGGYGTADGRVVRWGQVFRSDSLHRLTSADCRELAALGVRTVVDLRSTEELGEGRYAAADEVAFHHVPLFEGDALPFTPTAHDGPEPPDGEVYLAIAHDDFGATAVVAALECIARGEHPVVFHCAAGKDRTGLVAALVLTLCGVPDDAIVTDFAFTESRMPEIIARHTERAEGTARDAEVAGQQYGAQAATMHTVLESVRDEFGSVDAYVRSTGVTESEIDALRAALVQSGD